MAKNATLEALIAPSISALGYELLGCIYISHGQSATLRVYIDSENGITITDCERVSRQISAILDVEDPIASKYLLEVSSPGLDRPLFTLDQFRRFVGENVNIKLHIPLENRKHLKGLLKSVGEHSVVVEVDDKAIEVILENIARANLIPLFEEKHQGRN